MSINWRRSAEESHRGKYPAALMLGQESQMGILARSIVEFYRNRLGTMNKTPAMVKRALTCLDAHITTDELIKRADDLMYSVKKNGKNAIAYAMYAD
jgi:hypothetical protein